MSRSAVARIIAVVTVCWVVAACGSGDATKKDVIARGNAICAGTLRSVRAVVPPSSTTSSRTALKSYLERVLPLVEKEVSQLRKLPRPSADRTILNQYIAAVTRAQSTYTSLAAAAARNDVSAIASGLSALRSNPAGSLAKRYGLTQCASAAGTSVP
jgi:hypothetical protein